MATSLYSHRSTFPELLETLFCGEERREMNREVSDYLPEDPDEVVVDPTMIDMAKVVVPDDDTD